MKNLLKNQNSESGQTLIETIVAIFILTTTLISAVGLSIYVLSNSEINENELVATNLAREGIEVIRYMRDTNWLESDFKGASWDLKTDCQIGVKQFSCYPKAWDGVNSLSDFKIHGGIGVEKAYRAVFNSLTKAWSLDTAPDYNLYLQPGGFITTNFNNTASNYSRKILITENTGLPFDGNDSLSQLTIKSIVAWRNKKCNWAGQDPQNAPASCQIVVEDRLTNWKDYK